MNIRETTKNNYIPGNDNAWQFAFFNLVVFIAVFTPKYLYKHTEPLGVKNNGYRANTTNEIDGTANINGTV